MFSLVQSDQDARRFSTLGVPSVGVLIASGVVNTFHQVGDFPALLGTDYGRLLVAKLALFVVMLGLATVNRSLSARRLAADDRDVARRPWVFDKQSAAMDRLLAAHAPQFADRMFPEEFAAKYLLNTNPQ